MNLHNTILAATLALGPAAASAQAPVPTPSPAPRMDVAECQKRVAAGKAVIVDVRDAAAYNANHIAGALSVPLDDVAAKADELKKRGKAIVAYCA